MKESNMTTSRIRIVGTSIRFCLVLLLLTLIPTLLSFPGYRTGASSMMESFEGFLDIANCSQIVGWAYDADNPDTHLDVDIYSDGNFILTVPANRFRQDLLDAGKGNGEHGFSLRLPASLNDGQQHAITVNVSGTLFVLGNTPKTITCDPSTFEGYHDIADCTGIVGWAWDPNEPNVSLYVDVYFDNNAFSSILAPANQFRQDLLDAGKGNGFHGFSFPTPAFLKDGQPHTIRIKFSGTHRDLGFTGKMITCSGTMPPNFEGFHDIANCDGVVGWAWDSDQPNTPISVDIYAGPNLIGTVLADQFRQDLLDAGKGNGVHGFFFALPPNLRDAAVHEIAVGFSGTFVGLNNTPKFIDCPVGEFEGFLDVASCDQILGWAWDSGQPNAHVFVDLYADDIRFARLVADQFRQDLVTVGKGNGEHGFVTPTPAWLKDGLPHSITAKIAATTIDLGNNPKSLTCSPPSP